MLKDIVCLGLNVWGWCGDFGEVVWFLIGRKVVVVVVVVVMRMGVWVVELSWFCG